MRWYLKMSMATALTVSMTTTIFGQMQINASEWAVPSMQKAYQLHIVSEDVLAKATEIMTRKEFAEMAVQFYENMTGEVVNIEGIHNPFWDTDQPEVIFAYAKGMISGKTEHIFDPDSPLTREQMAIFLVRMLETSGVTLTEQEQEIAFTDIDKVEESVKPYIQKIQKAGIMNGFEKQFFPFESVKVEEAVVAFTAIYEKRMDTEQTVEEQTIEEEKIEQPDTTLNQKDALLQQESPSVKDIENIKDIEETETTQTNSISQKASQEQQKEGIVIDGKTILIGESVSQLKKDWGEPDRIDQNSYSLERYVYLNDYKHFFMVSIKEDKVAEIFTNDMSFQYLGITGKMDYADMQNVKYMDLANFRAELQDTGNDTYVLLNKDYKAAGILIRSSDYKKGLQLRYSTQFLENFETEIIDILNSARVQSGACVLQSDEKAKNVAYYHSWDMSKNNYVGYTNLEGKNPFDRMTEGGVNYSIAGESVVKIEGGDAIDVYHQWIMEAGTRTNILNPDMTHYGLSAFDSNFTLYVTLDLFTPAQTE